MFFELDFFIDLSFIQKVSDTDCFSIWQLNNILLWKIYIKIFCPIRLEYNTDNNILTFFTLFLRKFFKLKKIRKMSSWNKPLPTKIFNPSQILNCALSWKMLVLICLKTKFYRLQIISTFYFQNSHVRMGYFQFFLISLNLIFTQAVFWIKAKTAFTENRRTLNRINRFYKKVRLGCPLNPPVSWRIQ